MKTHRMSSTPIYRSWAGMKTRCLNAKNPRFHRYGGRGIKVCERWMKFENFLADMGPMPLGASIDRIDNDGNYEPKNCEWIPMADQAKKTSRVRLVTVNGETHSVSEWARILGVRPSVVSMRLNKYGWSDKEAVTTAGGVS